MLKHSPFYHQHLRKITYVFGNLFNDIEIQRIDDNNVVQKTLKIPISYAAKELWVTRLLQDPNPDNPDLSSKVQVTLPRMSYEMVNLQYDGSRKLPSRGQIVNIKSSDNSELLARFNPVPWNITYNLYVLSRNIDDSLQIIEQILPFFEPDFSITIHELPDMNITRSIPVVFKGITNEILYEGSFDKTRVGMYTLSFEVKAYLYQPLRDVKIIRDSTANLIVDTPDPNRGGTTSINVVPNPIDADPDDTNWTYNTTITDLP